MINAIHIINYVINDAICEINVDATHVTNNDAMLTLMKSDDANSRIDIDTTAPTVKNKQTSNLLLPVILSLLSSYWLDGLT